MKFSIIIPAYNEEKRLGETLEKMSLALDGIRDQFEVIVVNNESTDRTAEIAWKFEVLVVNEPIHNIARVRNTGANAASGDVFIFIDADTWVPEGLFQKIADAMEEEECFGGAVAVEYPGFKRWWMKYYLGSWKFWGNLFNMRHGAAQFSRIQAFIDIGGFDETIFMGEDIDFYWRLSKYARQHGGRLQFIDDPKVITSSRRFDDMGFWKTLLLTHPFMIFSCRKRKSVWKDWYENAIR